MSRVAHVLQGLFLATLAGAAGTCRPVVEPSPDKLLEELAWALPSRIIEARLSLPQPAEGCTPIPEEYTAHCTFPEPGSREYLRLAQVAARAQAVGRAGTDAAHRHLEGLALLVWSSRQEGTVEEAVARLDEAARMSPEDPDILSDLAAAHLEAARQTDGLYHLPVSLDVALRALEESPNHGPALFNAALSRELAGFPEEAAEGWRALASRRERSPWTDEGAARFARIDAQLSVPRLNGDRVVELAELGDLEALRQLAQDDPQLARTAAMDRLLPEWAVAVERGNGAVAEGLLLASAVLGDELADRSLARVVDEVGEILEENESPRLAHIVEGLRAFRAGRLAYAEVTRDRLAREHFLVATRELTKARSTLALWSDFWLTDLALSLLEYPQGQVLARETLALSPPDMPALRGLLHRVAGILNARMGIYGPASHHYAMAITELRRSQEVGYLAAAFGIEAEHQHLLGNYRTAWDGRISALRVHGGLRGGLRAHAVLHEAAEASRQQGYVRTALAMQENALRLARTSAVPEYVTEALVRRGRIRLLLADSAAARVDADSARRTAQDVVEPDVRSWVWAEVLRLESAILTGSSPSRELGLSLLDSALAVHGRVGHEHILASLLSDRSRLKFELGSGGHVEDARHAIASLERASVSLPRGPDRARLSEAGRQLSLGAAEMTALGAMDAEQGLNLIERVSRIAWAPPSMPSGASLDPPLTSAAVPPDLAILRYFRTSSHLLLWVLTDKGLMLTVLQDSLGDLEAVAARFVAEASSRLVPETLDESARNLAELVLPPEAWDRIGSRHIVVIPDGPLVGVPFHLLPSPSGPAIILERRVAAAPTIAFALTSQSLSGMNYSKVALIANSSAKEVPPLPALPGVRSELEVLRHLYSDPVILIDGKATRGAVLRELSQSEILHFAGHAVSGSMLAGGAYLALSADDTDGPTDLYAEDIMSESLRTPRIVVLTACASVGPDGVARAGGFWGIAYPLIQGGTRAVLGTLWPIPDREAAAFALLLHEELARGAQPSEALRAAQTRAHGEESIPVRTWASFQIIVGGVGNSTPPSVH